MIYFLQCAPDGPIKIGHTNGCVVSRLRQLQSTSPHVLAILGAHEGDRYVEAELHQRFAEHNVRGEWFHPVQCILDHIEASGGLDAYHKLERPDLKAALGRSVRKHWPQPFKDRYKSIRTPSTGRWLEGLENVPPSEVEGIESLLSDLRELEAAQ